ncbi:MAG TPA: response regulator transcription factor [Bacteroidales bacterium]|nr:response regulator transcription factor [Bacteroidales bacterium]
MMDRDYNILLVEDDPNFGSILKSYLELADYRVTLKKDGKQGLSAFYGSKFDLCILDVMMPEMDGFTLAREIRTSGSKVPLIFLTAKTLKQDILEGFRTGADDYLTKPFDSEVLLCKIAAILKRNQENGDPGEGIPEEIPVGSFLFRHRLRILKSPETEATLSPKEADLLKMLCTAKDGILPRREALFRIWGDDNYFTSRSMDVYIARLRKHLRPDPSVEIVNIHGNGFRLIS